MSSPGGQLAPSIGARFGNYRLSRELDTSTHGTHFEAEHVMLPRVALVKVMHATPSWVRTVAVQLLREPCILEALRHPGMPVVYESGVIDGRPWFAIELVGDDTLGMRLASGPLAPVEVAMLVRHVAIVLDHAHRRGVVHGGLELDRVVFAGRERGFPIVVTDWSEARAHDPAEPLDDRADVLALGAIAYHAMTGAPPEAFLYEPVRRRCPHASAELCETIDRMLASDPYTRPSAAEIRVELAWSSAIAVPRASTQRDLATQDLATQIGVPDEMADEIELIDVDGVPLATPRATSAPLSSLRLRRPRWTPMGAITSDHVASVSGELELDLETPPE